MSYLVFCSAEVGGLPFAIADTLNSNGVRTYYVSLSGKVKGHDSANFHFNNLDRSWNLNHLFADLSQYSHRVDQIVYNPAKIVARLTFIKKKYGITSCFATGIKSYLLSEAALDYYYWCYGSDLDRHCSHPILPHEFPIWGRYIYKLLFYTMIRPKARRSIRRAKSVMVAPYQTARLQEVCGLKKHFFLPHILKTKDFEILSSEKEISRKEICANIGADKYFFSAARHEWAGQLSSEPDKKGNDIVIKAFEKYVSITADHQAKLVFIEKGSDVPASKALIHDLGLDHLVVWLKEMNRSTLQKYYQGAFMCFGQFSTPVITYAALEPLANASICASFYGIPETGLPYYQELPPLINEINTETIAKFMKKISLDTGYYNKKCLESWQWVAANCSGEKFSETFSQLS